MSPTLATILALSLISGFLMSLVFNGRARTTLLLIAMAIIPVTFLIRLQFPIPEKEEILATLGSPISIGVSFLLGLLLGPPRQKPARKKPNPRR